MRERHLSGIRLLPLALAAFVAAACGSGGATSAPSASPRATTDAADPRAAGRAFVTALADGDVAAATTLEDDMLREAAPASQPAQIWQGLLAQYGPFERIGGVSTTVKASYALVSVEAYFADATAVLNVSIDGAGLVAGLHAGAPMPAPQSGGPPSPLAP